MKREAQTTYLTTDEVTQMTHVVRCLPREHFDPKKRWTDGALALISRMKSIPDETDIVLVRR